MNNKNYADISVIIPCYNSYKTIERALNSVVNQSLLPREIILVDDCSTNKTLELLNNFKKNNLKYNIIILSLDNLIFFLISSSFLICCWKPTHIIIYSKN